MMVHANGKAEGTPEELHEFFTKMRLFEDDKDYKEKVRERNSLEMAVAIEELRHELAKVCYCIKEDEE